MDGLGIHDLGKLIDKGFQNKPNEYVNLLFMIKYTI